MLKILVATAFLALPVFSFSQTQAKLNAADTSFGRYGSDCSSGRGACSFTVFKSDSGIISAKCSKKISENTILLQIARSAITQAEEISIAGKPFSQFAANEVLFFVQQDDLYLTSETLRNLNVDPKYSLIPAGNYAMAITKDKLEVVFTLR